MENSFDCPLCTENVNPNTYYEHLQEKHMLLLLTASSLIFPNLNEVEIINFFEEDTSYENLSELCEEMGNVYIGINNIDELAPPTIYNDKIDNTCPICLENFNIIENIKDNFIRKIKNCNHYFCNECISTWFEKHKTCPVCKKDVSELASASVSES
jgi:hypothetical protein